MIFWYCVISTVIVAGLLVLLRLTPAFQSQRAKNLILFFIALLTFLVHTSEIWLAAPLGVMDISEVDIAGVFILSPCSASMLGLLIVGFMAARGRGNVFGRYLAVGTVYIGFVGALVTNYMSVVFGTGITPASDWYMTANLVAHSLLLLACLYMPLAGFIEIKVSNIFPVFLLGVAFHIIGGLDILFFWATGEDVAAINPMYLVRPVADVWVLYGSLLHLATMLFALVVAVVYEFIFVERENRFYKNWTKDYWLKQ